MLLVLKNWAQVPNVFQSVLISCIDEVLGERLLLSKSVPKQTFRRVKYRCIVVYLVLDPKSFFPADFQKKCIIGEMGI